MTVENQHDIDGILKTGRVVARVRDAMLSAIEPGMTTAELDKLGGEMLAQYGAKSAPKVTYNFPGYTCISINEEAAHGFKVIRNLAGHGVGRSLHEEPEGIVGYFDRQDTRRLRFGQVIAIEPFLSTQSTPVAEADDGWTLLGHPANLSAQFEHTIIVTRGAPIVATLSEARG